MAIFECGFEVGNKAYYQAQGWTLGGSTDITTTSGQYHTSISGNGGTRGLIIDDQSWVPAISSGRWVHFWLHFNASNSYTYLEVYDATAGHQATVVFGAGGNIAIYRGSRVTLLATGGWTPQVDHWIAVELDISNTGQISVYADGALIVQYTGDVQQGASSGWTAVGFGDFNQNVCIDDLIITTTAEGRLSEQFIPALAPDGDDVIGLTPSTGTLNYALVDEIPQVDTDYNEGSTTLDEDTYTAANLGWTPDNVHCVGIWGYAAVDGTITQTKLIAKSGSTNYYSSAFTGTGTYTYDVITNIWNTDPDTASAWTVSGVNGLRPGIQVI